jgi:hypothetical protein
MLALNALLRFTQAARRILTSQGMNCLVVVWITGGPAYSIIEGRAWVAVLRITSSKESLLSGRSGPT